MQIQLRSMLNRLAALLARTRAEDALRRGHVAPLDPVERLHQGGSTFPVVMQLARLGW
jgi:hypothetical protein